MKTAAITLAILLALGWLEIATGWGVNFPSQRPAKAFRITAVVLMAGASVWLVWYFWRSL